MPRQLPQDMIDKIAATSGELQTDWLVDVWPERGAHASINTQGDWNGDTEPVNDGQLNVSTSLAEGSLVLAPGNSVAAPTVPTGWVEAFPTGWPAVDASTIIYFRRLIDPQTGGYVYVLVTSTLTYVTRDPMNWPAGVATPSPIYTKTPVIWAENGVTYVGLVLPQLSSIYIIAIEVDTMVSTVLAQNPQTETFDTNTSSYVYTNLLPDSLGGDHVYQDSSGRISYIKTINSGPPNYTNFAQIETINPIIQDGYLNGSRSPTNPVMIANGRADNTQEPLPQGSYPVVNDAVVNELAARVANNVGYSDNLANFIGGKYALATGSSVLEQSGSGFTNAVATAASHFNVFDGAGKVYSPLVGSIISPSEAGWLEIDFAAQTATPVTFQSLTTEQLAVAGFFGDFMLATNYANTAQAYRVFVPGAAATGTHTTQKTWTVDAYDRWETHGGFLGGSYAHVRTDYYYGAGNSDQKIAINFRPAVTMNVDAVSFVGQALGNLNSEVAVRFRSAAGGIVGVEQRVTLTTTATQYDVAGLSALLISGADYQLEIEQVVQSSWGALIPATMSHTLYTATMAITGLSKQAGSSWGALLGGDSYILFSGREGYQATGWSQRRIDAGQTPNGDGIIQVQDIVPAGASYTVEAWGTDNQTLYNTAGTASWVSVGNVADGSVLPAHRYWSFRFTLNANAGHDLSPELQRVSIEFRGAPLTIGTTSEMVALGSEAVPRGVIGLDSAGIRMAQLSPGVQASMRGSAKVQFSRIPEADDLFRYGAGLRGRDVRVRVGYGGSTTAVIYDGKVSDVSHSQSGVALAVADVMHLGKGLKVPSTRFGADWSATTTYAALDRVVYNKQGYTALANNTNVTPGTNSAVWQQADGVWMPVDFSPASNGGNAWHGVDALLSLLRNEIGVPTSMVDVASFNAAKQAVPNRTVNRRIVKPIDALKAADELAFLIGVQLVNLDGKLTAVIDDAAANVNQVILADDVVDGSAKLRLGLNDMINAAMMLTGYDGVGTTDAAFSDFEINIDAATFDSVGSLLMKTFYDRWGLPKAEAQQVAADYVTRYKSGRRVVEMKLMPHRIDVQPGDVFTAPSLIDFPTSDNGGWKMRVVRADPDFTGISMTAVDV